MRIQFHLRRKENNERLKEQSTTVLIYDDFKALWCSFFSRWKPEESHKSEVFFFRGQSTATDYNGIEIIFTNCLPSRKKSLGFPIVSSPSFNQQISRPFFWFHLKTEEKIRKQNKIDSDCSSLGFFCRWKWYVSLCAATGEFSNGCRYSLRIDSATSFRCSSLAGWNSFREILISLSVFVAKSLRDFVVITGQVQRKFAQISPRPARAVNRRGKAQKAHWIHKSFKFLLMTNNFEFLIKKSITVEPEWREEVEKRRQKCEARFMYSYILDSRPTN